MDWLKSLAPTAATMLGGPLAGIAVKFLADKLGATVATTDAVTAAMADLNTSPEGRIKLAELDAALRTHAIDAGVDLERLAAGNATDVNKTMQAESAAEHWPTYSWRPAIGFAVAIALVLSVLIVGVTYGGVMFAGIKPEVLAYLSPMLGSMAALIGVASPILGIASWFRGKAQADPNIQTNNKG